MISNKKAQVAIYVIIAIVVVGLIVLFFAIRGNILPQAVPVELAPAFDYYQQCIEQEARGALDLAGTQGGHVERVVPQPEGGQGQYRRFNYFHDNSS